MATTMATAMATGTSRNKSSLINDEKNVAVYVCYNSCNKIGPCARSDWSKTDVLSWCKTEKACFVFRHVNFYIIKQMKKPKPCITL